MAKGKAKRSQSAKIPAQSASTAPAPKTPTAASVGKTAPLGHVLTDQRLLHLREDHEWLLKQIRRKRTELDNFMNDMREIMSEMFRVGQEPMKRTGELDEEIHQLFQEIFTQRKFGKQSRQRVETIYIRLQRQGVISYRPLNDEEFEDDDEEDLEDFMPPPGGMPGAEQSHTFEPEPTPERPAHHREMRQTFLRLASIYHPDRATDATTQEQNTEIMKEINRAYRDGDFARLLELEQMQQEEAEEAIEINSDDDLDRACKKLERDNQTLRQQYEGIKAELRSLRNSTQEGQMLQAYRKCKKAGLDLFDQLQQEAAEEIEVLEELRDFVRDFRDRKITIKEFLSGPGGAAEPSLEDIQELLAQMLGVRVV